MGVVQPDGQEPVAAVIHHGQLPGLALAVLLADARRIQPGVPGAQVSLGGGGDAQAQAGSGGGGYGHWDQGSAGGQSACAAAGKRGGSYAEKMLTPRALPLLGTALLLAACGGDPAPKPDTTRPTVTLQAAHNGTTVNLTASATDNVGVTKVEFYRGSVLVATDTTAPYTASLAVTSADNGSVTFTAKAYDAAQNVGQGSASVQVSVTPPPATTPRTLYQGVWGWAAADASTGQIVESGATVLSDEATQEGRKVAVGAYTNEAQTQMGASLLGPITAAGELETAFSYDLDSSDIRLYLLATDDDGQLEDYEGSPAFFGAGTLLSRATQQPSRAVYVALLQVSDQVPAGMNAQAAAKRSAQALAVSAAQHQFSSAAARLQAQKVKVSALRQSARNLLQRR